MEFGDERYVRLFVRDTPGWLAMPWQARALAPLLLRKLDRAGTMEIGDENHAAVISNVVALPPEIVGVGLEALTKRGTVHIGEDGVLVWPNFLHAQEVASSDKQRARESRERRRERAVSSRNVTPASRIVTTDDNDVTNRDARVTPRDETSLCAVPCSAVPDCADPRDTSEKTSDVVGAGAPTRAPDPLTLTGEPESEKPKKAKTFENEIAAVWESYVACWNREIGKGATPKLDAKRRSTIKARLRDGYDVAQLTSAIKGMFATDHNLGATNGKKYIGLHVALGSADQVERHGANAPAPTPTERWGPLEQPPCEPVTAEERARLGRAYPALLPAFAPEPPVDDAAFDASMADFLAEPAKGASTPTVTASGEYTPEYWARLQKAHAAKVAEARRLFPDEFPAMDVPQTEATTGGMR
ncbi:MAG: hypothetical protein JWP97_5396 [Labilithrix sp.]|nr:hypothetical protein [Labilithrix sp.]